ncbi:MAG: protein translocase subunit SecF [Candidatus Geothermincolia bacterium]
MFIKSIDRHFDIMGRRRWWFMVSGSLMLLSVVVLLTLGLNMGLEFTGGFQLRLSVNDPATVGQVNDTIGTYPDYAARSTVQTADDGHTILIKLPTVENQGEQVARLQAQLEERFGGFSTEPEQEEVGEAWGNEVSEKALISLGVFLGLILIYISFRLEFKMAITGIVALLHDTLLTVGVYALTQRQVTSATIIAFLTILGYSLYDTIVVYDRVNENLGLMGRSSRLSFSAMVNESVNQTLVRSINTTVTTLIPIVTVLIFGGSTLKDFAFALLVGVFLGGYSSVFVAPPLLTVWKEREPRYQAMAVKPAAGKRAKDAILKKAEGGKPGAKAPAGAGAEPAKGKRQPEQQAKAAAKPAQRPSQGKKPPAKKGAKGPSKGGGAKKGKKKR